MSGRNREPVWLYCGWSRTTFTLFDITYDIEVRILARASRPSAAAHYEDVRDGTCCTVESIQRFEQRCVRCKGRGAVWMLRA